ncbi:MAG: phosphoribosyltransferase family protein [bacterium]|nr:phosphoribosyltransferase family protein [bacterium]
MQHITLMDQHHIKRTIKRLAIQVWEQMGDAEELIVFGLNERGYATAVILTKFLEEISDQRIQLHQFHVADNGQKTPIPNCTEKAVLIVDDVIFSGKTMFNALSTICYSNEPQLIEVLSLVDRGHRKYPVLCELTGISVPTKFGEHIEVILENNTLQEVVLFKNS